jgi:DNA-binding transcriptional LysR family regulator
MRLRHIELFHAIYTTGSITNAAKMLHISQPSVSKVLTHAELQLGFHLFERIKGKLIPTKEAEILFGEVDKIYQQISSIKNTTRNIKKWEFG